MQSRPLLLSLVLILATTAAGAAIRFVHLGLPQYVVKYGGSFFWAILLYWLVSTVAPRLRPASAALVAATIATAIEFFKLVRTPALDAFRHTLPGILILGRIFSLQDILAYCLAIAAATLVDRTLTQKQRGTPV